MKQTLIILMSLLLSILSFAQNDFTQTIKGTVIDKQAQFPMLGANVVLVSATEFIGTTTDMDGNFKIDNVPIGRASIKITSLGYDEVYLNNIIVNSAKEVVLNIAMEEKVTELKAVTISADDEKQKANNEMATVSARTMSITEMNKFAGSFADPARMSQNYAGVSGASDDRNDIIVRGNSPTGVLWRMEGVDIPSPNHFATLGTTGGPISMLNANNLRNSDFFTSAFPAEYGNATSGVFDLKLRNGNKDKFEFLGQVGFNGFEGGVEGPLGIGKNASFLANYRYSTLGVVDALGLDLGVGAAVPQYQDLTFKFNIPTEKAGKFEFWGVGGLSYIDFALDTTDSDTNLFTEDNEDSEFRSNTGFGGIAHTYFFNENTFGKLSVNFSANQNEGLVDTVSEQGVYKRLWSLDVQTKKYSANYRFNKKFNSKNRITAGINYNLYQFNAGDLRQRADGSYTPNFNFEGNMSLVQQYIQWQHRFNDKVTLNSGLHAQQLLLNNSTMVEPRIGVKYEASAKNTFSIGSGLHSQIQPVTIYFQERLDINGNMTRPNEDLTMSKSIHSVAAWDHLFNKDLRLKVEGYYQYLYDVAVDTASSSFSLLNSGADFGLPDRTGLNNDGTGVNYGVELTFEKFFSKNYYFLTTLSVFESQYKGSDGVLRNTLYNGNYVTNMLAGKEFPLNKKFTLTTDFKVTYSGGKRFTPFDIANSIATGDEVLFENRAFEDQYEDYFRADFKLGFRHNARRFTQTFSIDLQNVSNNDNVFIKGFNNDTEQVENVYQRGFFPDVRYQILF